MKYFIASDIHGSAYYGEKMLEAFKREGADKLLLLGDILYHVLVMTYLRNTIQRPLLLC